MNAEVKEAELVDIDNGMVLRYRFIVPVGRLAAEL